MDIFILHKLLDKREGFVNTVVATTFIAQVILLIIQSIFIFFCMMGSFMMAYRYYYYTGDGLNLASAGSLILPMVLPMVYFIYYAFAINPLLNGCKAPTK